MEGGPQPESYFDTKWYAKRYDIPSLYNLDPLAYYLRHGLQLGHETNPHKHYPTIAPPNNLIATKGAYDRLAIAPPWNGALQQQAVTASERQILVLGNIENALSRITQGVCIYMIYSDRPGLYLRHEVAVQALSQSGYAVIIINNCDSHSKEFAQSARTISDAVIVRKNAGRDFGAWVDFIAQHYRLLAKAKNVILLNDSVFGPTSEFDATLKQVEFSDNEIVGLSESHQNGYHVQSSFLYLRPHLFWNERFMSWIATYSHPNDKSDVIRLGEIGFSTSMHERGIKIGSIISYQDAAAEATRHAKQTLADNHIDSKVPITIARLLVTLRTTFRGIHSMPFGRHY